jgi:hypothetical protein
MRNNIKQAIPKFIFEIANSINQKKKLRQWEKNGKKLPLPHIAKQLIINDYQKKHNVSIFVETGTYMGDMVKAQLKNFKIIYSIELGKDLWEKANKRFENNNNVNILLGDSGKVFIELLPKINQKAIFWLDGHYSAGITAKGEKECPIYEELNEIFKSKINHILLIDDARLFIGENDYPSIEELTNYILANHSNSNIEIKDDIIRVELN